MAITLHATFENGVFVPDEPPPIAHRQRVRITVDAVPLDEPKPMTVAERAKHRLTGDAPTSIAIATDPAFDWQAGD